jgi:nucleotide-binding universal stress UspA family protein
MGLDPVTKLVFGGAVRQIAAFAKLIGADLVVVGRHRRGRFSRWWSGAAGDYITDHVNCSVLVARIAADAFEIEGH